MGSNIVPDRERAPGVDPKINQKYMRVVEPTRKADYPRQGVDGMALESFFPGRGGDRNRIFRSGTLQEPQAASFVI